MRVGRLHLTADLLDGNLRHQLESKPSINTVGAIRSGPNRRTHGDIRRSPLARARGSSMSHDEQFSTDEEAPVALRGRTRWLRFAGTMAGVGAAAATMVVLSAQGVLASSFSISGTPFVVTADPVEGK